MKSKYKLSFHTQVGGKESAQYGNTKVLLTELKLLCWFVSHYHLLFLGFFSNVCFQMSPQIGCIRGCIVTLVAFIWLFSTVYFHMRPQRVLIRAGKLTLVAFVRIFPQPTAEEGFTIDPVSIHEGYRKKFQSDFSKVCFCKVYTGMRLNLCEFISEKNHCFDLI